MKHYSTFSIAARLIAVLAFTVGFTVGSVGAVHAQESMPDPYTSSSDSPAKSGKTKQAPCGGPSVIKCPVGMSCVDDPADKCDPTKEGLNCPGNCVAGSGESKVKQPCGGPTRIACIGGMVCVDDPADNCDPTKDGLDCKGLCVTRP